MRARGQPSRPTADGSARRPGQSTRHVRFPAAGTPVDTHSWRQFMQQLKALHRRSPPQPPTGRRIDPRRHRATQHRKLRMRLRLGFDCCKDGIGRHRGGQTALRAPAPASHPAPGPALAVRRQHRLGRRGCRPQRAVHICLISVHVCLTGAGPPERPSAHPLRISMGSNQPEVSAQTIQKM